MRKKTLLYPALSLLSGHLCAGTMGQVATQPNLTWVATLSAGPVWASPGSTQTLNLTSEIEKTYLANNSSSALVDGEFFLGLQKTLSQSLHGQLGLAVAATSNVSLSRIIWDDADAEFDNFSYDYKTQHTHVAVKGKLLLDKGYWLIPWVSASLGVAFNNAHAFHSEPLIFEAVETPDFASHTQTSFTYTLGVGLQKALNPHWQVGVGYEFADWGKSQLGRAQEQTQGSGLALNHLYTNGLMFNLTYLA